MHTVIKHLKLFKNITFLKVNYKNHNFITISTNIFLLIMVVFKELISFDFFLYKTE